MADSDLTLLDNKNFQVILAYWNSPTS